VTVLESLTRVVLKKNRNSKSLEGRLSAKIRSAAKDLLSEKTDCLNLNELLSYCVTTDTVRIFNERLSSFAHPYIQGGPSEVIQSNISKTSRDREKCFI